VGSCRAFATPDPVRRRPPIVGGKRAAARRGGTLARCCGRARRRWSRLHALPVAVALGRQTGAPAASLRICRRSAPQGGVLCRDRRPHRPPFLAPATDRTCLRGRPPSIGRPQLSPKSGMSAMPRLRKAYAGSRPVCKPALAIGLLSAAPGRWGEPVAYGRPLGRGLRNALGSAPIPEPIAGRRPEMPVVTVRAAARRLSRDQLMAQRFRHRMHAVLGAQLHLRFF
jgi:hypothetical protein